MNKRTIVFPVANGVEDLEYYVTRMRLEEAGFNVLSAGITTDDVIGKNGLVISIDTLLENLRANELVGLVLAGGWAPDKLRRYGFVNALIAEVNAQGKTIGIICHGGSMAISAGIVKGRRATGSLGIKDDLINAGALWVDESAFTDENLVWGRVVADIPNFCRELVAAFKKLDPHS